MKSGRIHVRGNAGHGVGGAYRGSRHGMNRGVIIVDGNVGNEAGGAMRRGLIVIGKDAGDFAGAFMVAGSIVVLGKLGMRAGAGMVTDGAPTTGSRRERHDRRRADHDADEYRIRRHEAVRGDPRLSGIECIVHEGRPDIFLVTQ